MGCFRFPQGESYLPRRAFEIALQGELRASHDRLLATGPQLRSLCAHPRTPVEHTVLLLLTVSACLPVYLPACLPVPACLCSCACLPACLPACLCGLGCGCGCGCGCPPGVFKVSTPMVPGEFLMLEETSWRPGGGAAAVASKVTLPQSQLSHSSPYERAAVADGR